MGGTQDQADRSPERARGRVSLGSQKCHACQSTQFESAHDGGLVCVDCGVRLRGFIEEHADAGVADGGQLRYRIHRQGPRVASISTEIERPSMLTVLEAFQMMLQAQISPLERALGISGDDKALRAMIGSIWLRCVPLIPQHDAEPRAAPVLSIGWRRKGATAPALSPKLAIALLLIGCEVAAATRAVRASDLCEWCRAGVLPIVGFHRSLPESLHPVMRWLPSVLSPSMLPTTSGVEELAAWLRARLGVYPQVPTLRHLARQISHRLNLPEGVTRLAESIAFIETPYRRQPQSKRAGAASKPAIAVRAAIGTHAGSASAEAATQRHGPRSTSDLWCEAAAALFVACKLLLDLEAPPLDTHTPHDPLCEERPTAQAASHEAVGSGVAGPSGGASPGSDALWRQLQPSLVRAIFGAPRIADALLESTPSGLKGGDMLVTSPPNPSPPLAHRPSATAGVVVPWTALELLVLPPSLRCAHAHFCATALMPDPGRIGMYDDQREMLQDFEALGGNALGAYSGPAATGASAPPQPSTALGGESPWTPTRSSTDGLLLSDSDVESIAAKYVRCDSLPALHSARYGLILRALAVESHIPAARLERATRVLEKKLLPPPAPSVQEKSRKRPWDAEQLMACMEGWV